MTTLSTVDELRELARTSPLINVRVAGRYLQLGRNLSYELARRGEFPVPVLHHGRKLLVRTTDLLTVLGIAP